MLSIAVSVGKPMRESDVSAHVLLRLEESPVTTPLAYLGRRGGAAHSCSRLFALSPIRELISTTWDTNDRRRSEDHR